MNEPIRWLICAGGMMLAGVALWGPTSQAQDSKDGATRHAAKLYSKKCASCHAVPDPGFATDKAWIGQVLVTA